MKFPKSGQQNRFGQSWQEIDAYIEEEARTLMAGMLDDMDEAKKGRKSTKSSHAREKRAARKKEEEEEEGNDNSTALTRHGDAPTDAGDLRMEEIDNHAYGGDSNEEWGGLQDSGNRTQCSGEPRNQEMAIHQKKLSSTKRNNKQKLRKIIPRARIEVRSMEPKSSQARRPAPLHIAQVPGENNGRHLPHNEIHDGSVFEEALGDISSEGAVDSHFGRGLEGEWERGENDLRQALEKEFQVVKAVDARGEDVETGPANKYTKDMPAITQIDFHSIGKRLHRPVPNGITEKYANCTSNNQTAGAATLVTKTLERDPSRPRASNDFASGSDSDRMKEETRNYGTTGSIVTNKASILASADRAMAMEPPEDEAATVGQTEDEATVLDSEMNPERVAHRPTALGQAPPLNSHMPVENQASLRVPELCPFCDRPLSNFISAKLKRRLAVLMSPKRSRPAPVVENKDHRAVLTGHAQSKYEFCDAHRIEMRIIPKAIQNGWPLDVNFESIPAFLDEAHEHMLALIDNPSLYRNWEEFSTCQVGLVPLLAREPVSVGYYGEMGSKMIYDVLAKRYMPLMDERLKVDGMAFNKVHRVTFIESILVPEFGCLLIAKDLGLSKEEAKSVQQASAAYGNYLHGDPEMEPWEDREPSPDARTKTTRTRKGRPAKARNESKRKADEDYSEPSKKIKMSEPESQIALRGRSASVLRRSTRQKELRA